ncbi:hypothetical protein O181_026336 [Austropuccinia psidii MF-1]|uniref:Uncharacterized protein n=1 Tax=Austropuccinia psidii MF-1 TaxID=1389203 RepID=A0A9Q3CQ83_9BASI|nr:hypothetical protein [Austropuccinia psidii MF-1]
MNSNNYDSYFPQNFGSSREPSLMQVVTQQTQQIRLFQERLAINETELEDLLTRTNLQDQHNPNNNQSAKSKHKEINQAHSRKSFGQSSQQSNKN